ADAYGRCGADIDWAPYGRAARGGAVDRVARRDALPDRLRQPQRVHGVRLPAAERAALGCDQLRLRQPRGCPRAGPLGCRPTDRLEGHCSDARDPGRRRRDSAGTWQEQSWRGRKRGARWRQQMETRISLEFGLSRALWIIVIGIFLNNLGYGAVLPFEVIYLH